MAEVGWWSQLINKEAELRAWTRNKAHDLHYRMNRAIGGEEFAKTVGQAVNLVEEGHPIDAAKLNLQAHVQVIGTAIDGLRDLTNRLDTVGNRHGTDKAGTLPRLTPGQGPSAPKPKTR